MKCVLLLEENYNNFIEYLVKLASISVTVKIMVIWTLIIFKFFNLLFTFGLSISL